MTPVFWLRVYANRLFAVLLVAVIYGLLVSVKAQHVFPQGAAANLDSQVLLWFQFGTSVLLSLIFLAVGTLIWLFASERRVALLLFGFCSSMMMNFAALSVGSASDVSSFYLLFDAISSASTALSVPLLAALLLLFPKSYFSNAGRHVPGGQHSRSLLFLRGYLLCLGALGLIVTLYTLVRAAPIVQDTSLYAYMELLKDIYYLVGIAGILVTVVVSYRRSSTPRERQQLRLFVGGVVLSLTPVLFLTVLPAVLNLPPQEALDGRISALALGLLPLALGYSILRYQILVFDRYIRRIVAGIVGGVGLAMFGYFAVALNSVLSSERISFAAACIAGLTILGSLGIWLLAKAVTDHLFFSETLHYRRLIAKPTMLIDEALTLNEAARLLTTAAIDTFATPQVCFFVLDKESQSYLACPPVRDDDPNDAPRRALLQYLARVLASKTATATDWLQVQRSVAGFLTGASRPLLLSEVAGASGTRPVGLSRFLKVGRPLEGSDVLLAPVRAQGRLIGVLVLGPRGEQQPYAGPDFDIVQLLLARFSFPVETARVMLELRAAYERQKELDRLKDQFIITASHELRTPLTAVQGYIELLGDFDQQLPPEAREAFLTTARRSIDELALMVGNIMNVGRVEVDAEQITLRRVPLAEQVLQTAEILEAQIQREERALRVDIPDTIHVMADDFCLRQVMLNLLANALKYSPPGTDVEVTCDQPGNHISVCVRDYGLGVPPEDQAQLFERFVRLERDMNSPVRGTGLGLYISKQLIEAMGGRIWVESDGRPGQGSRFVFTLPSAQGEAKPDEKALSSVV
ncbi:MAG: sensor histidine kinase [Ktedonobacteraceae bacterium]